MLTISWWLYTIISFSANFIASLCEILSEKRGLTVSQNFLLSIAELISILIHINYIFIPQ